MSNVFSDRTTISSIHENPMVDTIIMNMLMFCLKLFKCIVSPGTNGGHLGFYPECNVQKYFLPTPLYGLTTLNKPKSREVYTNDGIITQNIFNAAVPTSIETK